MRSNLVSVNWLIISAECEPVLAVSSTITLGIITLNHKQDMLAPLRIIDIDLNGDSQSCLEKFS